MSGNSWGTLYRIHTFGESHGVAVGVVIDGCPSGVPLNDAVVQKQLDRRRPGQSDLTTPRNETDRVELLSGAFEGMTTGAPICMLVHNQDPRSRDYEALRHVYRPGHADFTWDRKFGHRDHRGGGRSSSRETIGRVCAGAVAGLILETLGITITGYVIQVGDIRAVRFEPAFIEKNPVRCADPDVADRMANVIRTVRDAGDSIGAQVEVRVTGLPAGLGEPVFDRLHADLGKAILSIPAVKGIEFGAGFHVATRKGSENNDELSPDGFQTNHAGGILGGISTGQDVVFRFPVKPPSSIRIPGNSVDREGKAVTVRTEGRHDPCIAPRVVPIAEAMTAITLIDHVMRHRGRQSGTS